MIEAARELIDSTVVIVGPGLVGGSLGLALEGQCARRIGVVRPGDEVGAGAVIERAAVDDVLALEDAIPLGDLVVLATPVETAIELVPRIAPLLREGAVLTDVASTKRDVMVAMQEAAAGAADAFVAIGGHPMAGGVAAGVEHARGDLFRDATWAICAPSDDDAGGDDGDAAVARRDAQASGRALVEQLVVAVDATPVHLDPATHDAIVARTSHLPYVLAQALVHAVGDVDAHGLSGVGLAGATRLAAGDVTMWGGILRTNADQVLRAIADLQASLAEVSSRIAAGGPLGELDSWLTAGRAAHALVHSDALLGPTEP